tara:strand:+ start:399 stop:686 length:288 start_codon:yes stop_codon:yes gene_type:complete
MKGRTMAKNKTLFGMCWVMFDYDTKLLKEVVIKPYSQTNQLENTIKADTPEQVRKLMNEYMEKFNLFSNTIYNDLNKNECKTYLGCRHCLRYKKQ